MHASSAIGLLALTFLVSLAAPLAGAQIMVPVSSSFDADAHGWTGDNPGEFFFEATGGNPDGFLHFDDIAPAGGVAIAPSNYLGDWSALDGTGSIRYDHRVIDAGAYTAVDNRRIYLSGPGGSAEWSGPLPCSIQSCSAAWETFVAPLIESDWTITGGTWTALLANVTDFRIQADHYTSISIPTANEEGLDNIRLEGAPAASVPALSTWCVSAFALLLIACGLGMLRMSAAQS